MLRFAYCGIGQLLGTRGLSLMKSSRNAKWKSSGCGFGQHHCSAVPFTMSAMDRASPDASFKEPEKIQ